MQNFSIIPWMDALKKGYDKGKYYADAFANILSEAYPRMHELDYRYSMFIDEKIFLMNKGYDVDSIAPDMASINDELRIIDMKDTILKLNKFTNNYPYLIPLVYKDISGKDRFAVSLFIDKTIDKNNLIITDIIMKLASAYINYYLYKSGVNIDYSTEHPEGYIINNTADNTSYYCFKVYYDIYKYAAAGLNFDAYKYEERYKKIGLDEEDYKDIIDIQEQECEIGLAISDKNQDIDDYSKEIEELILKTIKYGD